TAPSTPAYLSHMLPLLSLSPPAAPPASYTLSLHDALPICHIDSCSDRTRWFHPDWSSAPERPRSAAIRRSAFRRPIAQDWRRSRSEEHTSELQSRFDLVCRLLLEKKKSGRLPAEPG